MPCAVHCAHVVFCFQPSTVDETGAGTIGASPSQAPSREQTGRVKLSTANQILLPNDIRPKETSSSDSDLTEIKKS